MTPPDPRQAIERAIKALEIWANSTDVYGEGRPDSYAASADLFSVGQLRCARAAKAELEAVLVAMTSEGPDHG